MQRLSKLAGIMAALASSAAGYYHFIHYPSRLGPYAPIYEKFDLSALVNKTVYFHVSEERPALAPTDSYEALIGQVRQALAAWNSIPTSDLRVVFGGVANLASLRAQTPGGEISFEELPPGVLGFGGPTVRLPQAGGFVAIVRSRVVLSRDLTNPNRTSASESFFNSLVHEVGHALGLQHSLTGSAMTVEVTRSTSRGRPLGSDDAAGLSVLYPAAGFSAATGTITGRVTTSGGQGLHLVSVVAAGPGGEAVSALTDPEGLYRLEGLAPGTYIIYAHPLAPGTQPGLGPADIVLPRDDRGASFAASAPVETLFYGAVKDPRFSVPVVVSAGASNEGIDFRLAERGPLQLYDVTTYSFPGNSAPAVLPAFLNSSRPSGTVIAFGPGLSTNLKNVTVGLLAGATQLRSATVTPYAPAPQFAEIEVLFTPFSGTGPRLLFFSLQGDVYVRPSAIQLVTSPAPQVREVQTETDAGGNVVLALGGESLGAGSRVLVDGVPAVFRSFDEVTGRLRVLAPPGVGGRQATVIVYNPDGQSSVFVQPTSPATYTYPPAAGAPSLSVSPSSGRPGRDVMVEIQGTNTNFAEGQTVVGLGTPDVVTRRVWVLSPTRLLAVVTIPAGAALGASTVSVISGSQLSMASTGFRVEASGSSTSPSVSFNGLVNSATLQPRVAPGSLATLYGVNLSLGTAAAATPPLPTSLAGTTVTLNDRPVSLLSVTPTEVSLQIPFSMTVGPVILRVDNGGEASAPMVVQIDAVAPGLFRAFNAAGAPVDISNPAKLGETLILFGTGLGPVTPPGTSGAPAQAASTVLRVRVHVAGAEIIPSYAGLSLGTAGVYQVNLTLPVGLGPAPQTQIFLSVEGHISNLLPIALRAP